MNGDDLNQTQATLAGTAQYGDTKNCQTVGVAQAGYGTTREYFMSELAEKAAHHHSDQANKSYQAAEFFRFHPEFDTFIKLIRSGAIHI